MGGGKMKIKIGGGAKAKAGAKGGAKSGASAKGGAKVKAGVKGGAKVKAGAKGGAKVSVKAKRRQLQGVQPVTDLGYTESADGVGVSGAEYYSGLEIPTDLSHDGMSAVASANLLKMIMGLLLVLYAL